jgi:hypothetical protein
LATCYLWNLGKKRESFLCFSMRNYINFFGQNLANFRQWKNEHLVTVEEAIPKGLSVQPGNTGKRERKNKSKLRNSTQPPQLQALWRVTVPSTHSTPITPVAEGVMEHNDQIRASILFNSNTPQTQRVEGKIGSITCPLITLKESKQVFMVFDKVFYNG